MLFRSRFFNVRDVYGGENGDCVVKGSFKQINNVTTYAVPITIEMLSEYNTVTLEIFETVQKPNGRGRFRKFLPYVFTEHGALMLAAVLQSEIAISASIFVVRVFVKLREFLESNKELAKKIEELEARYDKNFSVVFEAIKQLIHQKNEPVKTVGFQIPGKTASTDTDQFQKG